MSLNIWRGSTIGLLVIVLLQAYWILSENRSVPSLTSTPSRPTSSPEQPLQKEWDFVPERDGRNVGLSEAQCDQAFPELYDEIERAVAFWKERGHTITPNDTDIAWRGDGAMKLMIHDNQLRVLEVKKAWFRNPYRKRTLYTLLQMYRAILGAVTAGEHIPDIEFSIVVDDMTLIPNKKTDTHTTWGYTRRIVDHDQDRVWLMPDMNFFASPPIASSYLEMQRRAKTHDAFLIDKIPKIVWRGVKWTNEYVRGHLLDATAEKDWADVVEIDWKDEDADIIKMEDLCRYMFVAHTEGRSWSGRMKYLFNCDSVPVIHNLDWTASYYHMLTPDGPDQNYIHVKRDFSDLEEKITYFLQNPQEAQRIADNSVATFRSRYTSAAAEACYWRKLMRGWSEVAFVPTPFESVNDTISGEIVEKMQLRGTAIEDFLWIPNDET